MRTRVICNRCHAKLVTQAELAGQNIKCPRCNNQVLITVAAGMIANSVPSSSSSPVAYATPSPVPVAEAEIVEAVFVAEDAEQEQQDSPALDSKEIKPAKRLRKKKKLKNKGETKIPLWLWIVGCAGGVMAAGGVFFGIYLALTVADVHNEGVDWGALVLQFVIGMPVSLIILFGSVYICSAMGMGIDFGDIKSAVAGGLFLIFIVNLVALIPFGIWFTLIAWLAGLMTIFGLYWEEAWILWLINSTLNIIAYFIMVGMLNSPTPEDIKEEKKQQEQEIIKQRRDPNWKEKDPPDNPGNGDRNMLLNDVYELMRVWIERQMA